MTFADFKKITKSKIVFDKYWHCFVALSFGVFSLFAIFYVTFIDIEKFRPFRFAIYPAAVLIVALGLSSVWLLTNRYKIVEIASDPNLDEKKKLVIAFTTEHRHINKEFTANYFT